MIDPKLLSYWRHVIALSNVREGERAVVIGAQSLANRYKTVAVQAASDAGAWVSYLEVSSPNKLSRADAPALKGADFLIDLTHGHDPLIRELLKDGTRVLVVVEPPEILHRMLPEAGDKQRVLHAQSCIRAANRMRVTSMAGTDFSVALGELRGNSQYGFSDEKGHWDQWPGAFVTTYGNEGSAEGTIVIDRGDMLFPQKEYVREPVVLRIERGYIRAIEGGADAKVLRSTFESYGNPEVYAVSHLGWGLSRNSRWDALTFFDKADIEGQDGRGHYGNFLFSTGPNLSGGGTRRAPLHLDIPLAGCSVYLNDEPMVLDGVVTQAEQQVR
jgi:2,5-dihydroxypyridine 5,6-dioxygenase